MSQLHGILAFAKTSKAAERLSKMIRERNFSKKYLAILKGNILEKKRYTLNYEYTLVDYLKKNAKLNKSFVVNMAEENAKKAELKFSIIKVSNARKLTLVDIELITRKTSSNKGTIYKFRTPSVP